MAIKEILLHDSAGNDLYPRVLLDRIYPVGSIYMSVNSTNPGTLFGGTWERIKDRFLLAAGDTYAAGATGGEATHTLTIAEMPNHGHNLNILANTGGSTGAGHVVWSSNRNGPAYVADGMGGSAAHNNMPPYLTVYMFKRTA